MSSIKKGFLCSQDGTYTFPLLPKVTTVGRENCDVIINSNNTDTQHAIIEYIENEGCFVLQDLNSINGTYVNDFRVQNAAMRLAEHDIIRFGFGGLPFQLIIQEQTVVNNNLSMPSLTTLGGFQRQTTASQGLQIINQTIPSRGCGFQTTSTNNNNNCMWTINASSNAGLASTSQTSQQQRAPLSLRSRPISACTGKMLNRESIAPKVNGWVKCPAKTTTENTETNEQTDNKTVEMDVQCKLFHLEKDMKQKDVVIKELSEKVMCLEGMQNQNQDLEQLKKDKSIVTGLVSSLQKDMTNKDAIIKKLNIEIESLKKKNNEKDLLVKDLNDRLAALKDSKKADEERQQKEKEMLVIRNKFRLTENKVVELNNQVMHIKNELEDSQKQIARNQQNEKSLRDELEHAKIQFMDMQRAERVARIDLGQIRATYSKLRDSIIEATFSVPGVSKPTGEITDIMLIDSHKKTIDENIRLKENIEELQESLKTNEEYHTETIEGLTRLENFLIENEEELKTKGRKCASVQAVSESLKNVELHDTVKKMRDLLVASYENETSWQSLVENEFVACGIEINSGDTLPDLVKLLRDRNEASKAQVAELEAKLEETKAANEKAVADLNEALKAEKEKELTELDAKLKEEHSAEISTITTKHEEALNLLQTNLEGDKTKLNEELQSTIAQLNAANELNTTLDEGIKAANQTIIELNEKIKLNEEEHTNTVTELTTKSQNDLKSYNMDMDIYKEQIKQHSLTIVELEKELKYLRMREIEYISEVDKLKKEIKENDGSKPRKSSIFVSETQQNYERTIETLKGECLMLRNKLRDQDEVISMLRRDLIGATAKLTDVQGELTDKQKRELEKSKATINKQARELNDARTQMAKLSEIVDKQTHQIEAYKSEAAKSKATVEKFKALADENGALVLELKTKLESGETQLKKFETVKYEEGKITGELAAIGAQCRGERHEQVIARQREALNDLRQKVKNLESLRPSIPGHNLQLQQQIMVLKKELAELRANQALSDDLAKQATLTRGGSDGLLMLEEKTAHFDTQSALDYSEETYLTLLRSIASMLDMSEIDGLRSMANLPPDERDRLLIERNKAIDMICERLAALKESLDRKDKLLRDYEIDLAKLRQTEFLLQKKSEQLEDAEINNRNKFDEIELLKESLRNAKRQLDDEKLVNTAIKQKRPVSVIGHSSRAEKPPHHHCPTNEAEYRVSSVKKTMNETIKKKDYELKVLKDELKSKQDELTLIANRLKMTQS